jgi:hypothetical protein
MSTIATDSASGDASDSPMVRPPSLVDAPSRSSTRDLTRKTADQLLAMAPQLAPEKITVDKIYAVIQQGSRTTINNELKA